MLSAEKGFAGVAPGQEIAWLWLGGSVEAAEGAMALTAATYFEGNWGSTP